MKEVTEITYYIILAAIFLTVMTVIATMSIYRYYYRRKQHTMAIKQFNEAFSQARMEVRDQIFKMIMFERSGLISALESEIRNIEKLGVLQPVFRISGKPVIFEQNKSLIIFRIVQEALHNVLKHAKATLVEMQVVFECDNVKLMIKDNGKGLPADTNNGRGLRNMRDRARIIGADFNLDSSASQGTLVMLTIPQRRIP